MTVSGIAVSGVHDYRVVVKATTPDCAPINSSVVTVTVVGDPTISVPPANTTICNGSTASLSVTVDGGTPTPLTYQWQKYNTATSVWDNVGTNSSAFTTAALTTNAKYHVIVTTSGSGCTSPVTSAEATVTVNNLNPGTIGAAQTICAGDIPLGFTSLTDATSVEVGAIVTYRWQLSTNGSTYNNISPAQSGSTYSPGALNVDTWYRRVAISTLDGLACESNATPVKITVNNIAANVLTAVTACESTSTTINGNAPTADGTRSYLWETSPNGIDTWSTAAGTSTGQNYTIATLTQDTWFRRTTTSLLTVNPAPAKSCSNIPVVVKVTVNNLDPGSISGDQTICSGSNSIVINSTNPGTGDGTIANLWEKSLTGIAPWTSTGVTTATYPATSHDADTWYRRRTRSTLASSTCDKYTTLVLVKVNNVTAGTINQAQTICRDDVPQLLTTLTAANADGGTLTYRWEKSITSASTDFSDISDIDGGNSETYQPSAQTQDTWYRRRAISDLDGAVCAATSAAVAVTVNNFTSVNTINPQTICETNTATITGNTVTAMVR
jgi:hypothetical protein